VSSPTEREQGHNRSKTPINGLEMANHKETSQLELFTSTSLPLCVLSVMSQKKLLPSAVEVECTHAINEKPIVFAIGHSSNESQKPVMPG